MGATALGLALLCGFAAAIEMHYGRRGFLPIDQATVFDGGWRTLTGQVPFRDYTTPDAITPSLIQGLFFWVLGVSWKAYLIHAAVFNALFALAVYVLLRLCRGGRLLALFYAALSSVTFYPPLGVPFHDQHSFFFTLVAITLATAARRDVSVRVERLLWASVPVALMAAALSKQTPVLLATPVVLGLALFDGRWRSALTWLAAGAVAVVALVVGAAFVAGVHWRLVWVYFFELPFETGQSRTRRADVATANLALLAAMFLVVVAVPSLLARRFRREPMRLAQGVGVPLVLSSSFLVVCAAFTALTRNEPAEGISLLFPAVGLFHVAVHRSVPARLLGGSVRLATLVGAAIVIVSALYGWTFNQNVNVRRTVDNLDFRESSIERETPAGLEYMQFQVPNRYLGLHARDLRDVVGYVRRRPGNFVLLGDTTVLSGLAGKPTMFPSLFVTSGLTFPSLDDPELERFERRLIDGMAAGDVRRVVIERQTWEDVTLSDFPRLEAVVRRCGGSDRRFGFFRVVELEERAGCP